MTERNCLILLLAILEFASHVFFPFFHHISEARKKHRSITGIGQLENRNFKYMSHIHTECLGCDRESFPACLWMEPSHSREGTEEFRELPPMGKS